MRFTVKKELGNYKGYDLIKTGKQSIQFYKNGKLIGFANTQKQVKAHIDSITK